jgi:hypothetical protein
MRVKQASLRYEWRLHLCIWSCTVVWKWQLHGINLWPLYRSTVREDGMCLWSVLYFRDASRFAYPALFFVFVRSGKWFVTRVARCRGVLGRLTGTQLYHVWAALVLRK